MQFTKKLMRYLSWLLLTVILGTVAFVLMAARQGWQFDAVLSGSMEPVYHVGGLAVFRPIDPLTVQVGDIISFQLPSIKTPICHRVIEIGNDGGSTYFVTKGDANEEADMNRVLPEYVKGRGVLHIPYVGRLTEVANLGRQRVSVFGKSLPVATLVIGAMGLIFIGLTSREMLDDILWPAKRLRRESLKKRQAMNLRRRKAFKVG